MKLIYMASPYAGDMEASTAFAKEACRFVMNEGHALFAPHRYVKVHEMTERERPFAERRPFCSMRI